MTTSHEKHGMWVNYCKALQTKEVRLSCAHCAMCACVLTWRFMVGVLAAALSLTETDVRAIAMAIPVGSSPQILYGNSLHPDWVVKNLTSQAMRIKRKGAESALDRPQPFCATLPASGVSHPTSSHDTTQIVQTEAQYDLDLKCVRRGCTRMRLKALL